MSEVVYLLPELFLLGILFAILISEITYFGEKYRLTRFICFFGVLTAAIQVLLTHPAHRVSIFDNNLYFDDFSFYFRLVNLVFLLLLIVLSQFKKGKKHSEYYIFYVCMGAIGNVLVLSANLLISFFCLLTLMTIGLFFISTEKEKLLSILSASKKYIFNFFSISFFILGLGLLFYFSRSFNYLDIKSAFALNEVFPEVGYLAFLFIFLGLSSLMIQFPMNLLVPDYSENSIELSSPVLLFFVPYTTFAFLLRFIVHVFGVSSEASSNWLVLGTAQWPIVVLFISGLTMLVPSVLAFFELELKKMFSYLMVSQMGFLVAVLLILNSHTLAASLYLILVNVFAIIGIYYFIVSVGQLKGGLNRTEIVGLVRQYPAESIGFLIFLGTFIGLPPFPGFIGRMTLISGALREYHWSLSLVMLLTLMVNLVCFTRIVLCFTQQSKVSSGAALMEGAHRRVFFFLLLPIVFIGLMTHSIYMWIEGSIFPILW